MNYYEDDDDVNLSGINNQNWYGLKEWAGACEVLVSESELPIHIDIVT